MSRFRTIFRNRPAFNLTNRFRTWRQAGSNTGAASSSIPQSSNVPRASIGATVAVGVAVVGGVVIMLTPAGGVADKVSKFMGGSSVGGSWPWWNWEWDDEFLLHNDPVLKERIKREKKENIECRELIFIRHGQYANMHCGNDDRMHLTSLGRKQATHVGKRLNQLFGEGTSITCLYNSNLLRARESGDIIMEELRYKPRRVESELLAEGYPCIPDPCPGSFIPWDDEATEDAERMEKSYQIFCSRPQGGQREAQPTGSKISPSVLAEMMAPKTSVEIYVCHGNLIRFFFLRALQLPPQAWLRLSPHHSSVTWLSINKEGVVTARCFGGTGHLNPNEMTA